MAPPAIQQVFSGIARALSSTANGGGSGSDMAYSSFAEPDPHLVRMTFDTPVNFKDEVADTDPNAQLRSDIRVMGSLLGKTIIQHEGPDIFAKVEGMRQLAKTWREQGAGRQTDTAAGDRAFAELVEFAADMTNKELYTVSRAFTHFLAIANAAEGHHRTRRLHELLLRESKSGLLSHRPNAALYPRHDSCGGVIPDLLSKGFSKEEVYQALVTQTAELVLTAHPTEVNRRTILHKNRRIQAILTQADVYRRAGSSTFLKQQLDQALQTEIASIWLSDEVSRAKPTPETEAEKGTLVLETVLWETVPLFLRKLDSTMQAFLGKGLPLDVAPIKFASWMGGDRDGNPNVKPQTTRRVCLKNRAKAASLFRRDLQELRGALSFTSCSEELRQALGDSEEREPYRALLRKILAKLERTEKWAQVQLAALDKSSSVLQVDEEALNNDIYLFKNELMEELLLIHRSLVETNNELIANGDLVDIIRNLCAFGLTLIPLDVRQESTRHKEALDCVTRYLGMGSYTQWDESTKINWLTSQITTKRPLLRPGVWREHPEYFSETAVDTLEIFQMIAGMNEESLGAYVISQATSASDVLAVLLLQLDAGVKKPLRVAPLFETLSDLEGAEDTMRTLFTLPAYMGIIKGRQEVMIGYSDSAKDAGRLAASWAQYETQEKLARLAKDFGVDLTFFHGKGGTAGRGGNPQTFLAIMGHAPQTIRGQFRVTEQGEMINQNFGFVDRAERSLDIYTAAILAEKLTDRPPPPQNWRDMMHTLSEISCRAYRGIVRLDERFVPYFRSATPELELANLNIGSRPAKRKATGGVESLRAIPWNFAWTQTRLNLPTWLGVGEAISEVLQSEKKT